MAVPERVQRILLHHLVTLPRVDRLAELNMRKLATLRPAPSLEALLECWPAAEPEIKTLLLCNIPTLVDVGVERNRLEVLALVENSLDGVQPSPALFGMLRTLLVRGGGVLPSAYLDHALQLLPKCGTLSDALPLLYFLIELSQDRDSARRLMDHLFLHLDVQLFVPPAKGIPPAPKKGRTINSKVVATQPPGHHPSVSLAQVIRGILRNRHVYGAFEGLVRERWSVLVSLLLLNVWKVYPAASRLCLTRYSGLSSGELDHVAVSISIFLQQAPENLAALVRLASLCASQGSLQEAGLMFTQAMRVCEPYEAREMIEGLSSFITLPRSSSWALVLLRQFCSEVPQVLIRHVALLKAVLDHLRALKPEDLPKYYECLLILAEHQASQAGDSSLANELIIIFRKQLTSGCPEVRSHGMHGLLALINFLYPEGGGEAGPHPTDPMEASCSQAPPSRSSGSDRLVEPFMELARVALNRHTLDFPGASFLSRALSPNVLSRMRPEVLRRLNALLSKALEDAFIYELGKSPPAQFQDYTLQFDADGGEALIGVALFDSARPEFAVCAAPLLVAAAASEKARHAGALDNIDAILGCPLLLPPLEESAVKDQSGCCGIMGHLAVCNWLRALIIVFCDQEDKEIDRKCRVRLEQLASLSLPTRLLSDRTISPSSPQAVLEGEGVIRIGGEGKLEASGLANFLQQLVWMGGLVDA